MDSSNIFDRICVRRHRNRAAARFSNYDFLFKETAERIVERLEDITRCFPLALDLGAHNGVLTSALQGRGGVETLVQADLSLPLIRQASGPRVVCDEEFLPFGENRFDAAFSVLSLHWVNDLPGALIQIQRSLKPDGLFLAVMPGANTLKELRQSILDVASQQNLPLAPMLAPQVEVRDAGGLLQRAGFALPVVDSESVTVSYENAFRLFADLRGMGETNALLARHKGLTPGRIMYAIAERYQERFGDSEGRLPATFEFVFLTGWKPHASQQQPAKRGSGQVNLKTYLQ